MVEQSTIKTSVSIVLSVILIVGFTAVPAAALTQESTVDDGPLDGIELDTSDSDGTSTEGVEVRIVNTNSPVQTGETVEVTVDVVTNDGGRVEFLIDGEVVEEKGFAPGQEDRYTFEWETSFTDAGNHTATVRSGADSDNETVQVEPGADAPEETCTNVPKRANENVPYSQLPKPGETLPEDAPNPVPPFVTPKSVANLVVGASPNQCDLQDPNDPSVDPNDPPTNPSADYTIIRAGQSGDGGVVWITYRAGLDDSGGPAVTGSIAGMGTSSGLSTDDEVTLNDGANTYDVKPRFSGDTSTADGEVTFSAPFGGAGGSVDCSNGECQPDSTGIPTFAEYPAVPAPIWSGED